MDSEDSTAAPVIPSVAESQDEEVRNNQLLVIPETQPDDLPDGAMSVVSVFICI